MNIRYLLILAWVGLFFACENTLEDYVPGYQDQEYFPLAIGHSWVYQLDSIIYDNKGTRVDTVSIQLKETLTDTFTDQSGILNFRVSRSVWKNNSWVVTDIWSASKDDKLAYRTEENLRFAKLSLPVIEGNSWDGNAFIDEEIIVRVAGEPIRIYQNWGDYRYASAGQAETIGSNAYSAVCTVTQVDLEDKISRRYSLEKYADQIGLVYKKMIILNTQKFDSTDPWELKAEEGFIMEQTLLEFEPGG